jgi:hypothetical protein
LGRTISLFIPQVNSAGFFDDVMTMKAHVNLMFYAIAPPAGDHDSLGFDHAVMFLTQRRVLKTSALSVSIPLQCEEKENGARQDESQSTHCGTPKFAIDPAKANRKHTIARKKKV